MVPTHPNVINRCKSGVDRSKESKSLVYITHVIYVGGILSYEAKLLDHMAQPRQSYALSSQLPSSRKSCLMPDQKWMKLLSSAANGLISHARPLRLSWQPSIMGRLSLLPQGQAEALKANLSVASSFSYLGLLQPRPQYQNHQQHNVHCP